MLVFRAREIESKEWGDRPFCHCIISVVGWYTLTHDLPYNVGLVMTLHAGVCVMCVGSSLRLYLFYPSSFQPSNNNNIHG